MALVGETGMVNDARLEKRLERFLLLLDHDGIESELDKATSQRIRTETYLEGEGRPPSNPAGLDPLDHWRGGKGRYHHEPSLTTLLASLLDEVEWLGKRLEVKESELERLNTLYRLEVCNLEILQNRLEEKEKERAGRKRSEVAFSRGGGAVMESREGSTSLGDGEGGGRRRRRRRRRMGRWGVEEGGEELQREVEELTVKLFQQANDMVREEKLRSAWKDRRISFLERLVSTRRDQFRGVGLWAPCGPPYSCSSLKARGETRAKSATCLDCGSDNVIGLIQGGNSLTISAPTPSSERGSEDAHRIDSLGSKPSGFRPTSSPPSSESTSSTFEVPEKCNDRVHHHRLSNGRRRPSLGSYRRTPSFPTPILSSCNSFMDQRCGSQQSSED
ncbi:hypothetical protein IE53DRAFT_192434 [Violaceomyces palustris]|uniref:Uncharacterized protein n=1 Tax=Violaceomyces palustris TaxID=1673888 RepID=A0ACD0NRT7_9BASI|nr:hypothetical protein IE53DRAFT_192434 [Violaceomyces palustris]